MSIRVTILAEITEVASEQKKTLVPLTDDLVLHEMGFDSLCFAILVARLEDKIGTDPFVASEDFFFPVTLGDFISFYEAALGSA